MFLNPAPCSYRGSRLDERQNPLDIGPSGIFRPACRAIFPGPNTDGFILNPVIPYAANEIWIRMGVKVPDMLGDWPAYRKTIPQKPFIAALPGYKDYGGQVSGLCGSAVATAFSPEAAVRVLSALRQTNLHPKKQPNLPETTRIRESEPGSPPSC